MIGYMDRTFCSFYENCTGADTCARPLTPAIKKAAAKWWGSDEAPISVFTDIPDCHSTKKANGTSLDG